MKRVIATVVAVVVLIAVVAFLALNTLCRAILGERPIPPA